MVTIYMELSAAFERFERMFFREDRHVDSANSPCKLVLFVQSWLQSLKRNRRTEWLRRKPWASADAQIEAEALNMPCKRSALATFQCKDDPIISDPTNERAADAPPLAAVHQGLKRKTSQDANEDSTVTG